jgi:hypothetical protein
MGLDYAPQHAWEARDIPTENCGWILELAEDKRERLTSLRQIQLTEPVSDLARKVMRASSFVWVPQHLKRLERPPGFSLEGIHFTVSVKAFRPQHYFCGNIKESGNGIPNWNPGNWPELA